MEKKKGKWKEEPLDCLSIEIVEHLFPQNSKLCGDGIYEVLEDPRGQSDDQAHCKASLQMQHSVN